MIDARPRYRLTEIALSVRLAWGPVKAREPIGFALISAMHTRGAAARP